MYSSYMEGTMLVITWRKETEVPSSITKEITKETNKLSEIYLDVQFRYQPPGKKKQKCNAFSHVSNDLDSAHV